MEKLMNLVSSWQMVFVMIAMVGALGGCSRATPIQAMPAVSYPGVTMADMEAAIYDGCVRLGWTPVTEKNGVVKATLHLRKHVAIVNITFTQDQFAINYVDSTNLKHKISKSGVESIHKNYNSWVQNLKKQIMISLATQAKKNKTSMH